MLESAATNEQLERGFHLGAYLVEPEFLRISRDDSEYQVEPKVMDVLLCLARNAGRTVTKERFMDEVWGGTVVTEDALLRCISELRKVFDDNPRSPRYVETIRKKGYRLIADVRPLSTDTFPGRIDPIDAGKNGHLRETPWPLVWAAVSVTAMLVVVAITLLGPDSGTDQVHPVRTMPLTSYPGEEADPTISPDGMRVAFVWDGGTGGDRNIYVKQIGVASPFKLTQSSAEDYGPAWSDDGRRIAFIRRDEGGFSIYAMPSVGGSERMIAGLGDREVRSISWSPDGRFLAMSIESRAREPFVIALVAMEDLDERVLTTAPQDYFGDVQPVFSPKGDYIAFVRRVMEKVDDVYVIPAAGGEVKRLTNDHAEVTGLDWHPDGRDLIYTSDREGTSSLWRVSLAGGAPRWIPTMGEGTGVYQLSVARRLRRMTFVERSLETNLWELNLRTGAAQPVISSTRIDEDPDVSSDGRKIAFISNRLGTYEVWVSQRDGSEPTQITELGGPFVSSPRWSPDGSRLAFVARVNGQIDVYTVDARGGIPQRITTKESNDREPRWSRDGNGIYFASNRSGSWQIWRKQPRGDGQPVQITRAGGFAGMESPDRQWIYYMKRSAVGIYRMRLPSGEEELIVDSIEPVDWGNWTIDRSGLYYIDRSNQSPRLIRLNVESREAEVLTVFDFYPKAPALSIVPGGSAALYTRVDRRDSDILLVEEFR